LVRLVPTFGNIGCFPDGELLALLQTFRCMKGVPMAAPVLPHAAVCRDYENLLQQCRAALETWQRRRSQLYRDNVGSRSMSIELEQLQRTYVRTYALLEKHEQSCQRCQYLSKIGGLDFESMFHAVKAHKTAAGR